MPALAADHLVEPLLEGLPCAAVLFEGCGRLAGANTRATAWLAVDPLAPRAAQHWDVVLLPLGDVAIAAARQVAAAGGPADVTVPLREGGALLALRATPFPEGRILVCLTEAVGAAAADHPAARERDALLAALPVAVWMVDAAGRLVRANAAAEAVEAGRPADTARARWEREAPHDPARQRPVPFLETPVMRALAGEAVRGAVLELRSASGVRRVAVHAHPWRHADGAIAGAVLVEVPVPLGAPEETAPVGGASAPGAVAAQLEQLVEERSRALLATHEAQLRDRRLAAVGQLAAGVMHDMNNVLNPIMAAAYLLRHHAGSPEAVCDYADRIRTAAETGAAIASRVGRFIRQEPLPGGDEPLELSALAAEVLAFTEPARERGAGAGAPVRVERAFAPGMWVRGLPGEIRAALVNLVQNGIDAMPEGGTLTVRTFLDGGHACVAVRDTGVGMGAEVRERAFEPFFTTKGMRGSGLGLAEVYGIARRHRGTATIASVPGRGTEVVLRLPQEPPRETAASAPGGAVTRTEAGAGGPHSAPGAGAGLRILVVEDQEESREMLQRWLRAEGHAVEAVGDCAGARARLVAAAAPGAGGFDLLLADVGLPDGDGWALVREARERHPALRAGVLTGWEPNPEREVASGVAFVLRKPWRLAELQAHVAGPVRPAPDGG
ncbi:MAG: response regulator [Gemmatimonadetes bacterium]|nr:response regulator [Gemmatimonadota bacterium]